MNIMPSYDEGPVAPVKDDDASKMSRTEHVPERRSITGRTPRLAIGHRNAMQVPGSESRVQLPTDPEHCRKHRIGVQEHRCVSGRS